MNSLLKSVKSITNQKNYLVKESLRKQLNTTIMELQGVEGTNGASSSGIYEETIALCFVLEAIFLHGLKDSLLNKVTEVLSGPDLDAMPQPSFWGPLLIFSHRQMINHIQGLKQITTEVGYCRAWIRVALNEGLLSSYIASIQRDNSALKPYYDRSAFIRDTDHLEIARRLIESIDSISFDLPCNTSLLNFWSSTPLLMAAIWSPPMKSCPIFSAVDIAKTINSEMTQNDQFDDVETASSVESVDLFTPQTIPNNFTTLSEDEALRIILANGEETRINSSDTRGEFSQIPIQKEEEEMPKKLDKLSLRIEATGSASTSSNEMAGPSGVTELENNVAHEENNTQRIDSFDVPPSPGNSLVGKMGWSTSSEEGECFVRSPTDRSRGSGEGPTYDALIKSYHAAGYTNSPDLQEFLEKYTPEDKIVPKEEDSGPKIDVVVNALEAQIGKIPREMGLDVQDYSCFGCEHPIGLTFAKAHVCSFSGKYYCNNCMATEEFQIPSRIIHNWDMKHYPVSQKSAIFLTDCTVLLDLKILNPLIYMAVDKMAQLKILRMQLNSLRVYLSTCREPIFEALQKKVLAREYLYEYVHKYSVADLLDVPSGTLAQQLQKIVEFARNHVLNCWLCSQKGFICEICKDPKVIYPFDLESTFRCTGCNAVFHPNCLTTNEPCPKCERRQKRIKHIMEPEDTMDEESSLAMKSN